VRCQALFAASMSAAVLALCSCAESLRAQNRAGSARSADFFWPPPRSTSLWIADPADAATLSSSRLGDAASRIVVALDRTGYTDERWYTVGAHYSHGFAVTTRLEGIDEGGRSKPPEERWSSRFGEASHLSWLATAREPLLPSMGRFRVFLLALTDLPLDPGSQRAPLWNEYTWMGGGGTVPTKDFPASRKLSGNFNLGIYVYEYESHASDGEGHFLSNDETDLVPDTHVRMSGLAEALSALAGDARVRE
jgi:hypothetical protein